MDGIRRSGSQALWPDLLGESGLFVQCVGGAPGRLWEFRKTVTVLTAQQIADAAAAAFALWECGYMYCACTPSVHQLFVR